MSVVESHGASRVRQRWARADAVILGGLAVLALVAVAIGMAGASRIQPVAGLAVILGLAYCFSSARRRGRNRGA
jgi:hypothetical protein